MATNMLCPVGNLTRMHTDICIWRIQTVERLFHMYHKITLLHLFLMEQLLTKTKESDKWVRIIDSKSIICLIISKTKKSNAFVHLLLEWSILSFMLCLSQDEYHVLIPGFHFTFHFWETRRVIPYSAHTRPDPRNILRSKQLEKFVLHRQYSSWLRVTLMSNPT